MSIDAPFYTILQIVVLKFNSRVKLWDIRLPKGEGHMGPGPPVVESRPSSYGANSSRGVVGMVLTDAGTVVTLSRGSVLTAFDRITLRPMNVAFQDTLLSTNSAYAKIALSPCHRWIAAGGTYGVVVVINVEKLGVPLDAARKPSPLYLTATETEVNGLAWGTGMLIAATDDGLFRRWSDLTF